MIGLTRSNAKKMNSRKLDRRTNGQALIEFALALPLVMILIVGVLEIGRAFQTKIVLTNAAREGTHYFIYDKEDSKNGFENTRAAILTEIINSGVSIDDSALDIDILCFQDANGDGIVDGTDSDGDGFVDTGGEVVAVSGSYACPSGSTIVIYVEKMFNLLVIGTFVDPMPIHSDARMLVP